MIHPYRGVIAAFATKHFKEKVVSPIFASIDVQLVVPKVDTDQLGTFSGEIPRSGSPREVVLKKARLGLAQSGLEFGIASEGTIGADPSIPFVISDIECMAWIDTKRNIEIVEFYRSLDIVASTITISENDSLDKFLRTVDFPNHSLIAKPESGIGQIYKGINTLRDLEIAMGEILKKEEKITIESDLRAHHSPSRRKNIEVVAKNLVTRLSSICAKCHSPGWGEVGYLYGGNCRQCGNLEANFVRGKLLGCAVCEYKEEFFIEKELISPAQCTVCNP